MIYRLLFTACLVVSLCPGWCQEVQWTADAFPGTTIFRDIDYLTEVDYPDNKDKLDIFLPEDQENVPIIFFLHGGALRMGDKSYGEKFATRMVGLGYGVVSPNYRLSPGVQHPAHVEDATAALAWTLKNIEKYGGDPSRLYISGHSAGAYLAALIFMDKSWLEKYGLSPDQIRANLSISPFLYVEETAKSRPKTVWGTKPEDWHRASVSPHIAPGIGPTLLLYGEHDADWRKDQIERFGQAMRQLGNTVRVVEIPARTHLTLITDMDQGEEAVGKVLKDFIKSPK